MATGEMVLVQYSEFEYGLYQYQGSARTFDLAAQDYINDTIWLRVIPDFLSEQGVVDIQNGQWVASQFTVEHLQLQLWSDVDVDVTGQVSVTNADSVILSSIGDITIEAITATDVVRIEGEDNIFALPMVGSNIVAQQIRLASLQQSIGSADSPMHLDQLGGSLAVSAAQDIFIVEDAGDLAVVSAISFSGEASLATLDGSIIDAIGGDATNIRAITATLNAQGGA